MKIAYVSDAVYPYSKGGKEKRLFEIASRLVQMGHEVHIFTMHWWKDDSKEVIENGIHLHSICKLYPMYQNDRRSIKQGLLFGLSTLRLINQSFDVLDVDHMPFFPVFGTYIVCKLRGKQLFGTWHERLSIKEWTDYMGKKGYISAMIEWLSVKLPDKITAASEHTKRKIQMKDGRSSRLSVVESGIDLSLIGSVKPANRKIDALYIGRFVKDKNVDQLVKAIAVLKKKGKNIKCVIVGHGIEKTNLKKLVKNLKLEGNVEILDPLPQAEDVYAYMKSAKVFVLPSVREGFGIVALEALACNTPVVTIDSPNNAARDLIRQNENGSIVDLDQTSLAKAIEYWMGADKQLQTETLKQMDWNYIAEKQAKVYAS